MNKIKKYKMAFTQTEAIIALLLVGIVSAIALPVLIESSEWKEYKSGLEKAQSVLNNALNAYYLEYGTSPQCGYWDRNEYELSDNYAVCTERAYNGSCNSWRLKDGNPLPADYDGFYTDCRDLWALLRKTLSVQRVCDNYAYEIGCIPQYKGRDEIYAAKNPAKTDYDVTVDVEKSGFLKKDLRTASALILTDGTIVFTNGTPSPMLIAVDVNGHKGPNKWGYDVHDLKLTLQNRTSTPVFKLSDVIIEEKGKTGTELILNDEY